MSMKLTQLVAGDMFMPPEWDREFNHIQCDSRTVKKGDLFIAKQGAHDFIDQAIALGAVAVLAEGEMGFESKESPSFPRVPIFYAPEVSHCLATWLARRYPLADMRLLAVTGTNGKSSVTQYIAQLAQKTGTQCAVLGTLGNGIWPNLEPSANTTADLSVLRRSLQQYQEQEVNLAALEVSSHGLTQGRVAELAFDVAIMTNLSQDHLDYHGSMENYYAAKKQLFTEHAVNTALINIDDAYGVRLVKEVEHKQLLTYGAAHGADVRYQLLAFDARGLHAEVQSPWGTAQLVLPLMGEFNVANSVAAIAALAVQGFDFAELCQHAQTLKAVAGRMELYKKADAPMVVIDFAHTADALTNVLQAIKPWQRRVTTVFGCGGDRDRTKRPFMREAAVAYSDQVWLTDDNVRFENPQQIFADVMSAANPETLAKVVQQHDRKQAIADAIAATPNDGIVLIAGKGHEPYLDIQGTKHAYSDKAAVEALGYHAVGGQS